MHQPDSYLGRYYDWLSRYQSVVTRLGHSGGFDPLTVHRLLSPDRTGVAPADVVHDRLLSAIGSLPNPRIVDAGCGFGGTIFYLHARLGGRYEGVTLSGVQRTRASREATRRGVSDACRFHVRTYDADLTDLILDGADLIIAVESLAHARDPRHSIRNLASFLRPKGRLAIIDDMPVTELPRDDPDYAGFRAGWSCPGIVDDAALRSALDAAMLNVEHDEDLTPLVALRDAHALERLVRANRRWRRALALTAARGLIDSLHGGLMLERLYQRRVVRYRFIVGRRV
jgi:SAM-dependent methyltransferase